MVTPFGVTPLWVAAYLRGVSRGLTDTDARLSANRLAGVSGKDFARCHLDGCTLTVPVQGGSHALKCRKASPVISDHGKWRREHLGALLTAYGKTPFYRHLMPQLEDLYDHDVDVSLEDFNRQALSIALSWIDQEALRADGYDLVKCEALARIDLSLSIFDALFRLGNETSWAIARLWEDWDK